ncbi:MAG: ComEC/Rec2 family competence protein, partial [Trueperaceae bacterium]|nr:ComEC/Rec2 family competence protein [Trueperaceae bacterium]
MVEARAPAFLPWAWPWAAGVVAGAAVGEAAVVQAAAAGAGGAAGTVGWIAAGSALALAAALLAVRRAGTDGAAAGRLGAWFAAGALLAALRTASVFATADPWADRLGHEVAFEARVVDGVAWTAEGGPRGVVLRGVEVPDGRAWLEGRLEALPGRRNPGGFDARAHYRRDGVGAALVVARTEARAPPPATARARAALRRGVVAGLDADAAAVMQALTLGLRGDLGPLRDAFAASGLAHVLALSGLHVGVLAGVLIAAVGGVGRVRSLVVVVVLVGYVAVVGPAPAVVRATAMVAFALLGRAYGIGGAGWGSHLALAAAASLLVRPAWVGDLGFQLSYLSVLGMGWVAPPLARRCGVAGGADAAARPGGRRAARGAAVRRWVARSLAVSLAAQVATLPLVASAFGAVPLAAPLANLA